MGKYDSAFSESAASKSRRCLLREQRFYVARECEAQKNPMDGFLLVREKSDIKKGGALKTFCCCFNAG